MEQELLQIFGGFIVGVAVGVAAILLWNKLRSGSANPANVKQEFETYKNDVESHFEETSKKFQTMTEQYQDLYQHLSVGATSLCRPDSVAAALVDGSDPVTKPAQLEAAVESEEEQPTPAGEDSITEPKVHDQTAASTPTDAEQLSSASDQAEERAPESATVDESNSEAKATPPESREASEDGDQAKKS